METAFDELYDTKKKNTRDESLPFFTFFHQIPKQVADTCQAVGVSEKFMAHGIPSGVLGPSQISHDRLLASQDAMVDSIYASVIIVILTFTGFNLIGIVVAAISMLYWFFHVGWWERTKTWYIKKAVIKYVNSTYNVYWAVFAVGIVGVLGTAEYFILSSDIDVKFESFVNSFLDVVSKGVIAFHSIFPDYFDENAAYSIDIPESILEWRFSAIMALFILFTIMSKFFFQRLYGKERNDNIRDTEKEMQYTGQTAMDKLRNAQ